MIYIPRSPQDEYFALTTDLLYQSQFSRKKYVFWPSEAGATVSYKGKTLNIGHCARALYYSFKGYAYSNPPSENFYTIVKEGKLLEQIEISKLKAKERIDSNLLLYGDGIKFKNWQPDGYSFSINGELDAVLTYNNEPLLIEYKTVSDYYSVSKFIKNHYLPRFDYLLQIGLYLYYLEYYSEDPILSDIRKAWLIILNRGIGMSDKRGSKYDIILKKDKNRHYIVVNGYKTFIAVEDILAKYEYIKNQIETDVIPERDFSEYYTNEDLRTLQTFQIIDKSLTSSAIAKLKKAGNYKCQGCFFHDLCYGIKRPSLFTNMPANDNELIDPVGGVKLML